MYVRCCFDEPGNFFRTENDRKLFGRSHERQVIDVDVAPEPRLQIPSTSHLIRD
jgi:hypothetical protein